MRIRIDITGDLLYSSDIPVRISDINYGNHTGNDAIVSLMHETRMQWLSSYRYTELNIEGTGLIMSDLSVEFKSESFYKDLLKIDLYVSGITGKSFDLYYEITCDRNQRTVIAKAKTGMVCFNYETKKIAAMPEKLLHILTKK